MMRMELELKKKISGIMIVGTLIAALTLLLLIQLSSFDMGLNLAFRNIPLF